MTKQSIIRGILSLALIAYLVFAISYSGKMARNSTFSGIDIIVNDSAGSNFVSSEDVFNEISSISGKITSLSPATLNTDSLEAALNTIDKFERTNCVITKQRRLIINVTPMIPVARIFDLDSGSYYINRDGKHISADAQYHIDVPVVVGSFDTEFTPQSLVPILEYVKNSPTWNSLVTSINVSPDNDIILVPAIRGHVINFGDTTMMQDKFDRLLKMYRKVLPAKGWEYYDTISVKWQGQVVATRAKKKTRSDLEIICTNDSLDMVDDIETMSVTTSTGDN